MKKNFNTQREIEAYANILKLIVIEHKENGTKSINTVFKYASRIVAEHINPVYASKKAYEKFYEATKKDIRKYDCYNIPKINGISAQKIFTYEHMIPAGAFRKNLCELYDKNELTIESIKDLILKQKICWVTKEEDKKLKELGYSVVRPEPFMAYSDAGIDIYI